MVDNNTAARDSSNFQLNLARALVAARERRTNEAKGICLDILAIDPELPVALGILGAVLRQEGAIEQSISAFEKAIAHQPEVGAWHSNLCALYRSKNRLGAALESGLQSVRCNPTEVGPRVELALTYLARGERKEASVAFREGVALDPENASSHMGLGEYLLSVGEYIPGWMEYAWRNKLDQARGALPRMIAAPWNGMLMPEGSLLLVADQGFGDLIQFARYIPLVRKRVPNLIVGWGPEVTALLGDHPDIATCIENWASVPSHDAYVLLSSLPQIFGTEVTTIPMSIPYMTAKQSCIAAWQSRLDASLANGRIRVGIAWAGRSTHLNNACRSVRLETLAPILATPGVDFVTLQKPFPDEDRGYGNALPNLLDISADLESFADTGAVIMALDLVIAVDTAVVHLAGALGQEAWVLIAEPADWRWLVDREDSVWYPTLRLFRQDAPTEWAPVMERVAAELDIFVRSTARPRQYAS